MPEIRRSGLLLLSGASAGHGQGPVALRGFGEGSPRNRRRSTSTRRAAAADRASIRQPTSLGLAGATIGDEAAVAQAFFGTVRLKFGKLERNWSMWPA